MHKHFFKNSTHFFSWIARFCSLFLSTPIFYIRIPLKGKIPNGTDETFNGWAASPHRFTFSITFFWLRCWILFQTSFCNFFESFLDAFSHLYKRVCPSVGPSVRPYVRPLRKCKNRVSRLFLATMRSYNESNDRLTRFESLLHYSCRFICLFVHLSLHICHMFNTRRDTARTHLCPVGLVFKYFHLLIHMDVEYKPYNKVMRRQTRKSFSTPPHLYSENIHKQKSNKNRVKNGNFLSFRLHHFCSS